MIGISSVIAAITGRRIAEHATAPAPVDPAEVTALRQHLAASEKLRAASDGEVRRLLLKLAEAHNAARDADEEIVRLRAANLRLADQLEAFEPAARYGPTAVVAG